MKEISINNKVINSIPLALSYFFYPVIGITGRWLNSPINQNWIDGVWGLLLLFSIFICLIRRSLRVNKSMVGIAIIYMIWVYLRICLNLNQNLVEWVPIFMELKPFFYIIFSWVWINTWGIPGEDGFITGGAWLGTILIIELLIEGITAGKIVRIRGSIEINYDAALLVLSSCFLIASKRTFSKIKKWKMLLIFLGLLASLSRTGLIVEIILLLIFWRSNFLLRALMGLIAFFSILVSFWTRNLPFTFQTEDRFWMWDTGFDLFLRYPIQFYFGFGVQPLPVIIPPQLFTLWVDQQQSSWGLSGIYAYNFHSFWLRFITSWGIILTIPFLYFLGYLILGRRSSKLLKILGIFFFLEGFTMGVIYLSNVAIPLIIAIMYGLFYRYPNKIILAGIPPKNILHRQSMDLF